MGKPAHKAPLKILFVDDEENVIKSLKRLVMDEDYEVLTATSGSGGLEVLKKNPDVALIVSDQRMPRMTGAEFLEEARELAPNAQRIILTGYAETQSAIDAINKGGAHKFITKPWDDNELILAIRDFIQRYELLMENARLSKVTKLQNAQLKELNHNLEQKVRDKTREIRENFYGFVRMFADLMSLYDPDIGGHVKRVAIFSRELCEYMGLEEADSELIELAALLHEIGLIGIPKEVLAREESGLFSTDPEREFIIKRPITTQRILAHIDILMDAGIIIRSHRERFDGTGYPDGLKGEEIHIGARILAICKAFDKHLYYRNNKRSESSAIEFIKSCAGKDFDPAVVAVFIGYRAGHSAEMQYRSDVGLGAPPQGVEALPDSAINIYPDIGAKTEPVFIDHLENAEVIASDIKDIHDRVLVTAGTKISGTLKHKIIDYKELGLIANEVVDIFSDSKPS